MRFYLFSLGCKVNVYENDTLRESLLKRGDVETADPEGASLIVINTCSVTSTADQKSRQHIRKMRRLSPQGVLVVMGCYSERHAQECLDMGADIVVGTSYRNQILSFVDAFRKTGEKIIKADEGVRHLRYEEMGQMAFSDNARAYLKIQDGCDNFCSYCLIPFLRGNSRSRAREDTLRESSRLVEAGFKEIIISGIHIGAYGKDLGDGSYRLADLLKDILDISPTLPRLRVSSIEESEISDRFLALLASYPAIVDHLHIPLQSGSSSVLKRMKRKYDTEAFLATLDKIRAVRKDIAITTDIIVGFPGESDGEWQETLSFLKRARFAEIHVFPFSSRQGTYAATLPEIDPQAKEARVHELLALSKQYRSEYENRFLNRKMMVLFEDYNAEKKLAYGHSGNYLLIQKASETDLHGQLQEVIYDESSRAD